MFSFQTSERIRLFKKFSLAVDKIDEYRKKINPEDRRNSKYLDDLYQAADNLVVRLKRLGGV